MMGIDTAAERWQMGVVILYISGATFGQLALAFMESWCRLGGELA